MASPDRPAPRRLAPLWIVATIAGATGSLVVAAAVFAVAAPTRASLLTLGIGLLVAPLCAGLGLAITRRAGGNPVGAYLALIGLTTAAVVCKEIGMRVLAEHPVRAESLAWLVALLAENAWFVFAAVGLLLLHFPDGRLPSPRWRFVPWLIVAAAAIQQIHGAVDRVPFRPPLEGLARPFGPPPLWLEVGSAAALGLLLVLTFASGLSLVRRHRRATMTERRQIRWLAVGGLLVATFPLLCIVEIVLWGEPLWLSAVSGVVGLATIPVTAGVAVLRPDLFDVDRVLVGAITWGAISASLLTLYAAVSVGAGVLLGRESALAAAAVTALAAVALTPVRRRLQDRVDRRLYPLRRSSIEAVDDLHRRIGAGTAQPEQLEEVLRTALRDPALRVGYHQPSGAGPARFARASGEEVPAEGIIPVHLGDTQIGVLAPGGGAATPELLQQIAERAAPTVAMAHLRQDLAQAVHEVESSRARLVQIGFEERRRLERDLHDGAQQRLVALGMDVRLAQRHLDDPVIGARLDGWVSELATAVAELRQIAHGIRPSNLDDGLPAAIARLVRGVPVPVDIAVEDSALPDEIATTVYFVVSEAVTNAVKHSQATRIELSIHRDGERLLVRVRDDGRGGAQLGQDSGLADRVNAMGGALRVLSPMGAGTIVEADLPCAS